MSGWVPLKRVARLTYGDALPAELRNEGKVPVIGSGAVSGMHDSANTRGPAIVVGRKGSYGSVYWAGQGGFVIDTAYFIDRRSSRADLRWLFYALQSVDLGGASQDVGVPGLSREAAHAVLIPSPPATDEQRRIADFLDFETTHVNGVVAAHHKLRERLLERRRTKVLDLVVGRDHAHRQQSRLAWVDSIPAGWSSTKISFVARMGSGHTPSRSSPE